MLFWRATLNQAGILALFPGWSFIKSISPNRAVLWLDSISYRL